MSDLPVIPDFLGPLRPIPSERSGIASLWFEIVSPENNLKNFQIEDQEQSMWCWVAVSLGVARLYEPAATWSQCRIASRFPLGDPPVRLDCCGAGKGQCNQPNSLKTALSGLGHLADDNVSGEAAFARITTEIDRQRPVCARILDPTSGDIGHFVVISGYKAIAGRQYLRIHDPADNGSDSNIRVDMPFEEFSDSYWGSPSQWTHSYFTS